MTLFVILLASGCVLLSCTLLYLVWVAHARHEEFERLIRLLDMELPPASDRGGAVWFRPGMPAGLARKFRQAGLTVRWRVLAAGAVGLLAAAGLMAERVGVAGSTAGLLAILLAAWMILELRIRSRMRVLSGAMLGFLERVRQLISVGNSLAVALERAVANSPPVVADVMTPTIRRIHNGGGVAESLEICAAELDLYELHLLATAARTNLRFGGSMTHILRNMIENIRRRSAIERELRADTTQIRASAWVLGLLPVLVAAVVMLSNRGYARWFVETDAGHRMIVYSAVSQAIGVWLMRAITRTRY